MTATTFPQWILYFFIYSIVGWICETIWCSVGTGKFANRGFLYGPLCPIYGFGAVFVLLICRPFQDNPIAVFISAALVTTLLEYFTAWLMGVLFKAKWWDYSKRKFNIKGRICLRNTLLFGLMSLVVMYLLDPLIQSFVGLVSARAQLIISLVVLAVFLVDLFFSARNAIAAASNGQSDKLSDQKER